MVSFNETVACSNKEESSTACGKKSRKGGFDITKSSEGTFTSGSADKADNCPALGGETQPADEGTTAGEVTTAGETATAGEVTTAGETATAGEVTTAGETATAGEVTTAGETTTDGAQ